MFGEDRLFWLSFKSCWVNFVRTSIRAMTPSKSVEGTEMLSIDIPIKDRMCSSGLEEGEVGRLRNLTWLYIIYDGWVRPRCGASY